MGTLLSWGASTSRARSLQPSSPSLTASACRCSHSSHSSRVYINYFRYVLMHAYGGLYLDLDAECLRNAEEGLAGFNLVLQRERGPASVGTAAGHGQPCVKSAGCPRHDALHLPAACRGQSPIQSNLKQDLMVARSGRACCGGSPLSRPRRWTASRRRMCRPPAVPRACRLSWPPRCPGGTAWWASTRCRAW